MNGIILFGQSDLHSNLNSPTLLKVLTLTDFIANIE